MHKKKCCGLLRFVLVIHLLFLAACNEKSVLETIRGSGELRFVTVSSPLTYFVDKNGNIEGIEYELAKRFAESLNVSLKVIVVDNEYEVVELLKNNKAHIGSSALTPPSYPLHGLQRGPSYALARRQLVYYQKDKKSAVFRQWTQDRLGDIKGMSNQQFIDSLSRALPGLVRSEWRDKSIAELLNFVNSNLLPAAIVDSHWFFIYRHLFPEIAVAFELTDDLPVAWLYQKGSDYTLSQAVNAFFKRIITNGSLMRIVDLYDAKRRSFNYVDANAFIVNIKRRLPLLKSFFKEAEEVTGIDWLLIAAMSYQESHWDPHAKSPTGVRGLMMLTLDTAELLGIEDRLNPQQSILGGARYFAKMLNTFPQRIMGDDRVYFALAAYNIGFGHLEDARKITQSQGCDPDKWDDVSKRLFLLSDENWYPHTEHGYARGAEPVRYVKNIQHYYDILKWESSGTHRIKHAKKPRHQIPVITPPAL